MSFAIIGMLCPFSEARVYLRAMTVGKTFRVVSLGCKVNQYEGRAVADSLASRGMREASDGEPADVCVANTCMVTSTAEAKSRKLVRSLRRKNPGAVVIATGCMTANGGTVEGADASLPNPLKGEVARFLEGERLSCGNLVPLGLKARTFRRARAVLKVQDGCASGCTYCVLPRVRGPERSVPLDEACAELRELLASGYHEVVIAGIHLGNYGLDLGGKRLLADLVRRAAHLAAESGARVRLSSVEVGEVGNGFLDAMRSPGVCPHLHLPLQSGAAGVLRAMARSYTPEEFIKKVRRAREALEAPAITTDVMVAFPGEDEQAFERTCAVVREVAFSRLHVFPFSPRPGTPAASLPGRAPAPVAKERAAALRKVGEELAARFARSAVGRDCELLAEDGLEGYTERYVRGRLNARVPKGSLVKGKAAAAEGESLIVEAKV